MERIFSEVLVIPAVKASVASALRAVLDLRGAASDESVEALLQAELKLSTAEEALVSEALERRASTGGEEGRR